VAYGIGAALDFCASDLADDKAAVNSGMTFRGGLRRLVDPLQERRRFVPDLSDIDADAGL
jgi:hypothetical protein